MSVNTYSAQSGLFNLFGALTLQGPFTALATNSIFITLQDIHGNQFIQNMPVLELNPFNLNSNGGATVGISKYNIDGILSFAPREIVWTKSFLSVPTAAFTTPSANDRGFQFSIFFN